MRQSGRWTRPSNSFSLVEVAISLGIASFALLSIVALLPIGVRTNQISTEETRASFILTAVEADLRNTHPSLNGGKSRCYGLMLPYTLNAAGRLTLNRLVPLNTLSTDTTIGLGENEMPLALTTVPRPRYQVSVIYTQVPAAGGLAPIEARLIVNWPAVNTTAVAKLSSLTNVNGYVEAYVTFPAP